MDYFEKRKLFKQSFIDFIEVSALTPKQTHFSPHFVLRENNKLSEAVSTGNLDSAEELKDFFLQHVKQFKHTAFIKKMKKIILKYSKLLNLDIEFFDMSVSTDIELKLDYKSLLDIESISFVLRGQGGKTGYTTFHFCAYLSDVEASYEIAELDGRNFEHQSMIVICVNHKKVDNIILPMLNSYKDIISQLLGYEVTHVDEDIITVLDMIKI